VFIAVGDIVHQESQPFDGRHELVVAFQIDGIPERNGVQLCIVQGLTTSDESVA
jgi:hypothetical protein